jgi:hypothetical protein
MYLSKRKREMRAEGCRLALWYVSKKTYQAVLGESLK